MEPNIKIAAFCFFFVSRFPDQVFLRNSVCRGSGRVSVARCLWSFYL